MIVESKVTIPYYQVNAFTSAFSGGNPAGVCSLGEWLPVQTMQAIARENNLSETAFFVKEGKEFGLRWFTPSKEVDLCGHATLASAYVLFTQLNYKGSEIIFDTRSGKLRVSQVENGFAMLLPREQQEIAQAPADLLKGLGHTPVEVLAATDYMLVFADENMVHNMQPEFSLVQNIDRRCSIITAASSEPGIDFVSRVFGSKSVGIEEDPVTGSAHCALAPYWAEKLGKSHLVGKQVSARQGLIVCDVEDEFVRVSGDAVMYLKGEIYV